MTDDEIGSAHDKRRLRPYRLGFAVTAMLLLAIVVMLPFSVASIVDDVMGPTTGKVFPLIKRPGMPTVSAFTRLHVGVTAIDETHQFATLRVSGHHTCTECAWTDRVLFVSLASDEGDAEGLPPSTSVTLPASSEGVSKLVELPVRGFPIRYPFDRYDMVLAVALQRIYPDGRVETLSIDETPRHLALSIQELPAEPADVGARACRLGQPPGPRGPRTLRRRLSHLLRAAALPPRAGRPDRAADRVGCGVLGLACGRSTISSSTPARWSWESGVFARSSRPQTSTTSPRSTSPCP